MSSGPDVIHIGFSKCASTFLQTYFRQHPDIFLVLKSHYFAPFEHCHFDEPAKRYTDLFSEKETSQVAIESDEHIILPLHHPVLDSAATTLESVTELSARIRSIQPTTKLIIVVRNQADLILSRYSEYMLAGGSLNFDRFVRELLECSTDGVNYFQNYYSRIWEALTSEFSKENVLLIFQEDLKKNEALVMSELCEFLGVKFYPAGGKDPRSRRVGLSLTGMRMMRIWNSLIVRRPAKSYRRAEVVGPYSLYKSLQLLIRIVDLYLPSLLKGDKHKLLAQPIVDQVRSEFSQDNARLAELLNRNLEEIGYCTSADT